MKRFIPMLLPALLLAAGPVCAEKADAFKQTRIDCSTCQFDGASGKARMSGQVVITRGTLRIDADRGQAEQSPEGYQRAVVEADPGNKVRFRQKSDGPGEQWLEGEAMRVEYDERSGVVKLYDGARVRRLIDGKAGDEIMGEIISYNSRTEMLDIPPSKNGGRGTIIFQPKRSPAQLATMGAK